jgi:protein-disulfide isomerase
MLQKVVDIGATAGREHDVTGTPTFLINNRKVEGAANWETLEPRIRRAVGG